MLDMPAIQVDEGAPQKDQINTLSAGFLDHITITDDEDIIAIATPHDIGACAAIQRIIAVAAEQPIGKPIAKQTVIAGTAQQVFNPGEQIPASSTRGDAGDKVHRDRLGRDQFHIARPIEAGTASQSVIATTAGERVGIIATIQ